MPKQTISAIEVYTKSITFQNTVMTTDDPQASAISEHLVQDIQDSLFHQLPRCSTSLKQINL